MSKGTCFLKLYIISGVALNVHFILDSHSFLSSHLATVTQMLLLFLSDTSFTIFIDTVIILRISLREIVLLGYITAISIALPHAERISLTLVCADHYS